MDQLKLLFSCLYFLSFIFGIHQLPTDARIKVVHQWTYPDFLYPNEQARSEAISKGALIPENTVILDTNFYQSRVFATTPQFNPGTPATLSEVTNKVNSKGENLLKPFPSWTEATSLNCKFAKSVFRTHIDKCGLMWVLDSGRVNVFGNTTLECRPKILIYDLKNEDELFLRYEFPDGNFNEGSSFITLVTESYQNDCMDSFAYIADPDGHGLVVFDLRNKKSWRADSDLFKPTPNAGKTTVAGVTYDLTDGIFGIALGAGGPNDRNLYFHSYASFRESWVPVSVLKNAKITQNPVEFRKRVFTSEAARTGQSTLEVMTNDGILLFADIPKLAIMCWNHKTEFKTQNIHLVYQNNETLQFISGMKLKEDKTMIITSSRLQNYMVGNMSYPGIKYRMIVIDDVHHLLKGSPCKKVTRKRSPYGRGHKVRH